MSTKTLIRVTDIIANNGDDAPDVTIVGRSEHGERIIKSVVGTRPYFFVPEDELFDKHHMALRSRGTEYTSFTGESISKVVMDNPRDVGDFRKRFKTTFEDDVPYDRRISSDEGLTGYIRIPSSSTIHIDDIDVDIEVAADDIIHPRVCMADIETIPPEDGNFDGYAETAPNTIIMLTFYDTYTEQYWVYCLDPEGRIDGSVVREYVQSHWTDFDGEDVYSDTPIKLQTFDFESDMLTRFIHDIAEDDDAIGFDLLSGWNFVDFDHRYLLNRMNRLEDVFLPALSDAGSVNAYKTSYQPESAIEGLPGFDMMDAFCGTISYGEFRSQALDYVAEEELGVGKLEGANVLTQYETDPSQLLAYNIIDVQLLVAMDNRHQIHDFMYDLALKCNIQITDCL